MKKALLSIFIFGVTHFSLAKTEKYRLSWREDPSSSMVIGWTQDGGQNPVVFYDTLDCGQETENYSFQKRPDVQTQYKGMVHHFARLTNLKPNTAYYFVIKDSQEKSKRFWFKTAPHIPGTFTIVAGGDSRNNRDIRKKANLMVAKLRPLFVGFGGDYTRSDSDEQWQHWLDDWQLSIGKDGRMIPILAARGNHEKNNEVIVKLFDFPDPRIIGAFSFGGNLLRYYLLNTEIVRASHQKKWLDTDLWLNEKTRYKIVQYHKPIRPHVRWKRNQDEQYEHWAPLFQQYRIGLVVECDGHTVKQTWPIIPSDADINDEGFIRNDSLGTVYVGEGCWGAPLRDDNDTKSWTRDSGKFNQFKWIHVTPDSAYLYTVKVDSVKEVGIIDDNYPLEFPENIKIWKPSNGARVDIPYNEFQ